MDKQNRLTRWDEWELGSYYQWKKGRYVDRCVHKLLSINKKEGFVEFEHDNTSTLKVFVWKNRYMKYMRI